MFGLSDPNVMKCSWALPLKVHLIVADRQIQIVYIRVNVLHKSLLLLLLLLLMMVFTSIAIPTQLNYHCMLCTYVIVNFSCLRLVSNKISNSRLFHTHNIVVIFVFADEFHYVVVDLKYALLEPSSSTLSTVQVNSFIYWVIDKFHFG